MIKLLFILLVIVLGGYASCLAQPFKPDENGYIADPKFKDIIDKKGYNIVGAFDTINYDPLTLAAFVVNGAKQFYINTSGEVVNWDGRINRPIKRPTKTTSDQPLSKEDYFIVKTASNKFGTKHRVTQKIGMPAEFDDITIVAPGKIIFKQGNKWGLASTSGKLIIEPRYDAFDFLGYNGKLATDVLVVKNEGKYGLITTNGVEVLQPSLDLITSCNGCDVSNNLIILKKDGRWGMATKGGKTLLKPEFYEIRPLSRHGHVSYVTDARKEGVIDSLGNILLQPTYPLVTYLEDVRLFKVLSRTDDMRKETLTNVRGQITSDEYDDVEVFKNGLAVVKRAGKFGLINSAGRVVINPTYDYMLRFPAEQYFIVRKNGKYGLIDKTEKAMLPFEFDELSYNNEVMLAKKNSQWLILNKLGVLQRILDYEDVKIAGNYYVAKQAGKTGLLDKNFKTIIPFKYDRFIGPLNILFQKGTARAMLDGKNYLLDRYGHEYSR